MRMKFKRFECILEQKRQNNEPSGGRAAGRADGRTDEEKESTHLSKKHNGN